MASGIDLNRGRTALDEVGPRIDAAETTTTAGLNTQRVALRVVDIARGIEADGLRPRFLKFDNDEWSIRHVDDLLPLSLATLALIQLIVEAGGGGSAKVDADTLESGRTRRERMLTVLEYNCSGNALVMRECADIRHGWGYYDMVTDLDRLGGLYEKHEADLRDDKKHYNPADAQAARDLSAKILAAITSGETPEQTRLRKRLGKLLTLLKTAYEETAVIGRVILRHGDKERFPEHLRALVRA